MHLKVLEKRAIQKTAEATGDLIGNKIAGKISKTSQKNSKTVTNEEEILREKKIIYIYIYI